MSTELTVLVLVIGVIGFVVGLVVGAHQFGEAVEYLTKQWLKYQPRVSAFCRRTPRMSLLWFLVIGGGLGALVAGGVWAWLKDRPTAQRAEVRLSDATEQEKRRLYADFMKLLEESWMTGLRRQRPVLEEKLRSLEHTMNLINPFIPATRGQWNNTLQDFRLFVELTATDRVNRSEALMADRVKEYSAYRANFQNGLYYELFGGEPWKPVTKAEVTLDVIDEEQLKREMAEEAERVSPSNASSSRPIAGSGAAKSTPKTAPKNERSADPAPRFFLDLKPKDLVAPYRQRNTLQADLAVAGYRGKWMKVTVVFEHVLPELIRDELVLSAHDEDGVNILLYFDRSRDSAQVAKLRGNQVITVVGTFDQVPVHEVVALRNCEIVEPK